MKLNPISTWISLTLLVSAIGTANAIEFTVISGEAIGIKHSAGKTTYYVNSDEVKEGLLRSESINKQNLRKRINKCDRLVLAHHDAGLHRHHPEQYFEVEQLLEESKKHPLSLYKEKARSSLLEAEQILISIENRYPDQNFSSIRNCFNLTRWEQCI
jgi:hypothetical protein